MTKSLLSIGECMVELATTSDTTCRIGFAGDSFNTAWHARRSLSADWKVEYFTCLGDDDLSSRMLAFMAASAIGTTHIARLKGKTPGLYLITLDQGERSFTYWRDTSAARHLADDEDRLTAAIATAECVFFSGITLAILAPAARATLLRCLAKAKHAGKHVAFDSNIRPRLWPDASDLKAAIAAAANVSTITLPTMPDETDLFGEADATAVARRYLAAGAGEVVVKSGPGPALLATATSSQSIAPSAIVTPVDTTGAGDSFNGAYLAARLQGASMAEATVQAHANAARVILHHGALV
jgi:2-dehydro-3-deoxygluconokinase